MLKNIYIFDERNINMCENNEYIVNENNTLCTKFASADLNGIKVGLSPSKNVSFYLLE